MPNQSAMLESSDEPKMTEPPDYPNLRSLDWCALCDGAKDIGNVVCWPCWRAFNFRNGVHPEIEHLLKVTESMARSAFRLKKRWPQIWVYWRDWMRGRTPHGS